MASYRGHLMLSAPLGVAYGALPLLRPEFDWGTCVLGAGLCTIGGLLPDLDSDSGVPIRELFSITAALAVVALFKPLEKAGLSLEQAIAVLIGVYFFMRYGVSYVFKHLTVHRGMFHSIPATVISGLVIYLAYPTFDFFTKVYLSGAVMLGYLSHLVLDEIYAVDFNGVRIKFNQFAGSALKFGSASWMATLFCYALLFTLGYLAYHNGLPDWALDANTWRLPREALSVKAAQ